LPHSANTAPRRAAEAGYSSAGRRLANGGDDTINAIKQAAEFGTTRRGQKLAGLGIVISIIHALGLDIAQGLLFTDSFYWDMNDTTRAWSKRFFSRAGRMPGMIQAGTYSSVLHYLRAMKAAGSAEGSVVAAQMRAMTVDDVFASGRIREDGRLLHDFFLSEVKAPGESAGPWDYCKIRRRIPAEEAALPLAQSKCALVKS
jgi:branched-chain amino acid transport system substrate-binding protein